MAPFEAFVAHLLLLGARLARPLLAYADYLAPKLMALHEAERITAPHLQAGLAVLKRVANRATIYNGVSFSEFTLFAYTLNLYLHNENDLK